METSLYLDRRSESASGHPLKIYLRHQEKTIYISTGVFLREGQWDKGAGVVRNHPKAGTINRQLARICGAMDDMIGSLPKDISPKELKWRLESVLRPATEPEPIPEPEPPKEVEGEFREKFFEFAKTRRTQSTQDLYWRTWKMMLAFDPGLPYLTFSDIDIRWMKRFDAWLAKDHSLNGRAILFRNIRAVFNDAIDDELTTCYPFRRFKVKTEETRHRDLTAEDIRWLKDAPQTPGSLPHEREYIDLFILSFCLIGINLVDMKDMSIRNGRAEYRRAKTHKLYDVKIEPEAMELIEKYSGGRHVINIFDRFHDYNQLTRQIGKGLRSVGRPTGKQGRVLGEGRFPELTYYWARHSWASIASEIDIPHDVIAHALGHGKRTVTDIYIHFDQRKVDEANRKVLDYVFKGIDWRQSSTGSMRIR